MTFALYVLDTLFLLFFSLALCLPKGRRPGAGEAVGTAVCFLYAVTSVMLLAGFALRALRIWPVTLLCLAFFAAGAAVFRLRGLRLATFPSAVNPKRTLRAASARFARQSPWLKAAAAILLAVLALKCVNLFVLREYGYDANSYHLPGLVSDLQQGAIVLSDQTFWANAYPRNVEMLNLWQLLFSRAGLGLALPQFCFGLLGGVSVWGLLREFGVSRKAAGAGTLVFLSTPILLAQMSTAYADGAMGAMMLTALYFLVRFARRGAWADFVLFAFSDAWLAGVKYAAVAYCAVFALAMLIVCVVRLRRAGAVLAHAGVLAAVVAGAGGFWYYYNIAVFGNPLYPFTLSGGSLLYHGASMNALLMDNNLPAILRPLPGALRVLVAWLGIGPQSAAGAAIGDALKTAAVSTADQRIGGFGFIWPFVLLPCAVWLAVSLIKRKAGGLPLLPFGAVATSLIVCFLITPNSWWSRYTCFIVFLGVLPLALLLDRRPAGRRFGLLLAALIAAGCLQGSGESVYHDALLIKNIARAPSVGLRAASLQTEDAAVAALDTLANQDAHPVSIAALNINTHFYFLLQGRRTQNTLRGYGDFCLHELHTYADTAAVLDAGRFDYVLASGSRADDLARYARETGRYRLVSTLFDTQYNLPVVVYRAV